MTFEKLTEIITSSIDCTADKVLPEARLIPDVCKDSLDTVELSMALEDNTGVNVPDDLMATFRSVNDLLEYLNEHGA